MSKKKLTKAELAALVARLSEDDVQWIVNDIAELGVKIGTRFFFLYKGQSLEYKDNADGPVMWRPVWKREFGECCHPWQFIKDRTGDARIPDNYPAVDGSSASDWKTIPQTKVLPLTLPADEH